MLASAARSDEMNASGNPIAIRRPVAIGPTVMTLGMLLVGCAPSLATLQPAHVAPRGHVQATAGIEIGIPTGTIDRAYDAANALTDAAEMGMLADSDVVKFFDAAVNLAASPPSVGQHFAAGYSFLDRAEVGIRNAGGGWRLGGRYQFLRHQDGPFDLVVGLGAARATTPIPFGDVVPFLKASDFTRWTFDLPVLVGTSRSWFRVWAGPKLLYSRFDSQLTVTLPNNPIVLAGIRGDAFYYGGQGGVAVGYRYVYFGIELTLGQLSGSATTTSMLATAPSHTTDLSGFVVYPAFALMGEF